MSNSKHLVITEKPSVARQFAQALSVHGNGDGYIENDEWIITWCVGHLITLSYPEKYDTSLKKWRLESLPFLPATYKYEVIPSAKKQYGIVKELLNRKDVDVIYNAGDSGREGEYIQRLVYTQAGVMNKKKILRVWIDSQTEEEIKRGIREAKPSSEYDLLSDAAYMRAIEDYSMGINLSRALSCKYGQTFNRSITASEYVPIAVGRVMTCVLGMIVNRENEINNFKETLFYKIAGVHEKEGFKSQWKVSGDAKQEDLYNDSGFLDESKAQELLDDLNTSKQLIVTDVKKKEEKKYAPLLYNLAELQSECSKRYHISPDETLAIAQSLYEKKLTTYPRTDARVLSTAVCKEIRKNIDGLRALGFTEDVINYIYSAKTHTKIVSTKYCDDSKITDHYAIIPTGETASLTGLEEKVYELIVRRFLAIFLPPALYEKTELTLMHKNKHLFTASKKSLTSRGFLSIYKQQAENNSEEDEESGITKVALGDVLDTEFVIEEGSTQPPKRYTSGSMILAMENAGNLIEEEELREQIKGAGIGTSATRAEVIKKLVGNNYIALEKKTQVLTPTQIGFSLVKIVESTIPQLLSPKMTASWESGLSQIENGKITQSEYRQKLEAFITKTVNLIKEKDLQMDDVKAERDVVGKCPLCGADIISNPKGYGCSSYDKEKANNCKFFIGAVAGKKLMSNEVRDLLTNGRTKKLNGFTSKNGKSFSAILVLKDDGTLAFEFKELGGNSR